MALVYVCTTLATVASGLVLVYWGTTGYLPRRLRLTLYHVGFTRLALRYLSIIGGIACFLASIVMLRAKPRSTLSTHFALPVASNAQRKLLGLAPLPQRPAPSARPVDTPRTYDYVPRTSPAPARTPVARPTPPMAYASPPTVLGTVGTLGSITDETSLMYELARASAVSPPTPVGHRTPLFTAPAPWQHTWQSTSQSLSPPYQVSTRAQGPKGRPSLMTTYTGQVETASDAQLEDAADACYRTLAIRDRIDTWAQQVRFWLASAVIRPVAKDLARTMTALDQIRRAIQAHDPKRAGFALDASMVALVAQPRDPLSVLDVLAAHPTPFPETAFARRYAASLRPYLVVGEASHRDGTTMRYVKHRLAELAVGDNLRAYRWNAGGTWDGKPWGPHLPTDAQLVMHAFALFCSSVLPDVRSKCFYDVNTATPSAFAACKGVGVAQVQRHPTPPYYVVTLQGGKEVWRPPVGRRNVFHAIALFAMRCNASGRLDGVVLRDTVLHEWLRCVS